MGRPIYYQAGPGECFCIITGDNWEFDVVPARNAPPLEPEFPTRLAALEHHLQGLEHERATINEAIAKAKRLRRAWTRGRGPKCEVGVGL